MLDLMESTDRAIASEKEAGFNLLDLYSQEKEMNNKFGSKTATESASFALPSISMSEDLLAKVGAADQVKTSRDQHGVVKKDYYMADHKVFSDCNDNGVRTRTSFDITGRVEGKRVDHQDGSSISVFKGDFDTYRVLRDRNGITVQKSDSGDWLMVTDPAESSEVLRTEKQLFTPPNVLSRSRA